MSNFENQMNKKLVDLKENPGRIFALVYPYVLVIGIALGIMYVKNLNDVARQTVPPGLADTTEQKDLKIVQPKIIPPIDIMQVSNPNPDLLAKGENVFKTICSSCHGEEGQGNGPASAGLSPSPRNFTSKEGWKSGPKLSSIYQTLEEGIPNSGMISYDYLTPEERISVAQYIRKNFIPSPPQDTKDELEALDATYGLSQGKEVPAQIPVAAAMELIIEENKEKMQEVFEVLNKISNDNSDAAKIFMNVTDNETKAITSIYADKSWKQSQDKFLIFITSMVNQNGFNGKIFELSNSELAALFNYLNGRI